MAKQEEIIKKIEALLAELSASLDTKPIIQLEPEISVSLKSKFSGLTKKILTLIQEGFFDEPRDISEISKRLRRWGYNKPTTSLSGPLRELVKKNFLDRDKLDGEKSVYKYFIKK